MITEAKIREGLRDDQFLFHYQPKVSLESGAIVGAEALIRWEEPDGSTHRPDDFIPLAERSQLIKEISGHLFPKLIADILTLHHTTSIPISFNVSARDFDDTVLCREILDSLDRHHLEPESIEVEITESQAMACGRQVMRNLARLGAAGIGLTMDDYGIGYSSIDTLSKWPFTTIKLDQGIIGRMLESEKNATIVRSSIRLGHELNIHVVAEGVENRDQYGFLLEAGCKVGQGYLFGKPLALEEFIAFEELHCRSPGIPSGLIHMAMIDHLQWRRRLVSYALKRAELPADSPLRQSAGYPALSPYECRLGKWYFGEGQLFAGHPAFVTLDVHHRTLHEIGNRIVGLIQAGARADAINPVLQELANCSVLLLTVLEALEDSGLADMHRLN